MDLIIINNYKPPAPSKFDVDFSDVNGAIEQLENGLFKVSKLGKDGKTYFGLI